MASTKAADQRARVPTTMATGPLVIVADTNFYRGTNGCELDDLVALEHRARITSGTSILRRPPRATSPQAAHRWRLSPGTKPYWTPHGARKGAVVCSTRPRTAICCRRGDQRGCARLVPPTLCLRVALRARK